MLDEKLESLALPRFLGVLTLRIALSIIGFFIALAIMSARLDLMAQPMHVGVVCIGALLMIAVSIASNMFKEARVASLIILAIMAVWVKAPSVADSAHIAIESQTVQLQRAARASALEEPVRVECNRDTAPSLVFFSSDTSTGERIPRKWYSESDRQCWDRPGVHPQTGEGLIPVTPAIVDRIMTRPPDGPDTKSSTTTDAADEQWGKTYTYVFSSPN